MKRMFKCEVCGTIDNFGQAVVVEDMEYVWETEYYGSPPKERRVLALRGFNSLVCPYCFKTLFGRHPHQGEEDAEAVMS